MNNINAKKAFLSKLQNYKKFFILSKYSLRYLPLCGFYTNICSLVGITLGVGGNASRFATPARLRAQLCRRRGYRLPHRGRNNSSQRGSSPPGA